jgi:hypothetical protein
MSGLLNGLPAPPYPADTRAKGWRFELDLERVQQSDTWALASPDLRPWLLMLWAVAWQQTPCGSMPSEDRLIAARLGMSLAAFGEAKETLMRGWWMASDGRMYHETITERVVDMLSLKDGERTRKAAYRARKDAARKAHSLPALSAGVPEMSHGTDEGQPRDSHGSDPGRDATGTRTSIKAFTTTSPALRSGDTAEAASESFDLTPTDSGRKALTCPAQRILDLYHECMPNNPRVKVLNASRRRAAESRWREAAALTCNPFGYTTQAGGLEAWRIFFEICNESAFLTGKAPTSPGHENWKADFDFLTSPKGFAKALENRYH